MYLPKHITRGSPPLSSAVGTRPEGGLGNRTARPAGTSGFGPLLAQEHEIQLLSEEGARGNQGALGAVLREQQMRVRANIALLGERDERRPHAFFFPVLPARRSAKNEMARSRPDAVLSPLTTLIGRHQRVLGSIGRLMAAHPEGQRDERILARVAHSHEEMVGALTGWFDGDSSPRAEALG